MKRQSKQTKTSLKNIKVYESDLNRFNILCIEEDNLTQPELFKKIMEEYRYNGNK